jgi:glucose-6-phosphate dehydrogenase assembly protein OpcA
LWIDVAAIERELDSLWKRAGEHEGGVVRACTLNLLVYQPAANQTTEVDEVLTEITATHPCRAILIVADRDAPSSSLTAEVTSRCRLATPTSKQVCCEQVTLRARGVQVNEAPSAATPLLLSDLPVYLWWRGAPRLMDRVFRRLIDVSDRVIIDSADFAEPDGDLLSLAAAIGNSPRWTAFSDLNWARLTAWRALLAGFYDVADYRLWLDRLDRVSVKYAAPVVDSGEIAPRALLLAGWLASRLGWQVEPGSVATTAESSVFTLSASDRSVEVELIASTNPSIEPGRIESVTLASSTNLEASFNVTRGVDRSRIETEVVLGGQRRIQRVLGYENWSEAALVARELEIQGHDGVYEQAVLTSGELIASAIQT